MKRKNKIYKNIIFVCKSIYKNNKMNNAKYMYYYEMLIFPSYF